LSYPDYPLAFLPSIHHFPITHTYLQSVPLPPHVLFQTFHLFNKSDTPAKYSIMSFFSKMTKEFEGMMKKDEKKDESPAPTAEATRGTFFLPRYLSPVCTPLTASPHRLWRSATVRRLQSSTASTRLRRSTSTTLQQPPLLQQSPSKPIQPSTQRIRRSSPSTIRQSSSKSIRRSCPSSLRQSSSPTVRNTWWSSSYPTGSSRMASTVGSSRKSLGVPRAVEQQSDLDCPNWPFIPSTRRLRES